MEAEVIKVHVINNQVSSIDYRNSDGIIINRTGDYLFSTMPIKDLVMALTGIDVPIVEQLHGATQIGMAKADAKELYGVTHTPYIDMIVKDFKNNSINYAKASDNLLRSKTGKEVMLRLNFIKTGEKNNKPVYEFENFEFHPIKKSIKQKILSGDLFMKETYQPEPERSYMDEYRKTIVNYINKIMNK